MKTLEDVVESVIESMTSNEVLFTALDVSNKVKETLPSARHREVRDLVRQSFDSLIEPRNYAKTPIKVTLNDNSSVEAILYHPLVDSWDLDDKYNDQQRSQKASRPAVPVAVPVPATIAKDGTLTVNTHSTNVVPPAAIAVAPLTPQNARALWDQMFANQPSLFPRK